MIDNDTRAHDRSERCVMCNKELIGIHDHGVKVVPSPKGPRPNAFLPGGMAHRGNLTEGEIVAAFKSGYLVPRPPAEQAATIATLRADLHTPNDLIDSMQDALNDRIRESATLRTALDEECCDRRHVWPCPTIPRCDEPGCEQEASCGWPTRPGGTGPNGGYRRTCGDHMRAAAKETP